MSHLIDIFLQPGKAFTELKDKPTFLLPLLIVVALAATMTLLYFMRVDAAWYLDHALSARNADVSAADAAKARAIMPGAHAMGLIGAASAAVGITVVSLLYALYFLLAGKIAGVDISFRRGLSLTCWSNMPIALATLVAIIAVATMSPQTPIESVMLTNFDPLVVHLPMDSAWSALARNFNLLYFWVWFLLALGWKTWGRTSWMQALIVALLPSVVIYGVMAVIASMAQA